MQLLNKLQIAVNESKKNGILDAVKFVFVHVHSSLKLVLHNPYKNWFVFFFNSELELYQFVNKVATKRAFPYDDDFEELLVRLEFHLSNLSFRVLVSSLVVVHNLFLGFKLVIAIPIGGTYGA